MVSHAATRLDPSTFWVHHRLGGSAKFGAAHRRTTKRAFTARASVARPVPSASSRPTAKMLSLTRLQIHYAETSLRSDGSGVRDGCVSTSARRTNHRLFRASSRVVRSLTCGHELFRSDSREFTFTLCTAVPHYPNTAPNRHAFFLPKAFHPRRTSRLNSVSRSSRFPRYEHILITDDLC